MNRRQLLSLTAGAAMSGLLGSVAQAAASGGRRPNIVFILADDLGIDALGAYGGESFKTPNLDRLAAEGMRFDWCYCTPVCGPTRAQLMTGQYPFRNGALDIDGTMNSANPDTCPAMPAILKSAGYVTGMTGKWKQMRLDPGDWGFDHRLVSPTANGYYWNKEWSVNGQPVTSEKEVYFPDVMSDFALKFINDNRDKPFFFYYAMTHPHTPIVRTPDSAEGVTDLPTLYADNIAYLDKLVGKVVAELDKLGLRENTVILFTGDNGSLGNVAGKVKGKKLDGGKAQMRNGGAHVPLIANWMGTIKPGACGDLVDFTDVLPTLAEVGGAKLPADRVLDGRSFLPQLKGEKGNPREWVYVQLGQDFYVRGRDYRLDHVGDLYDMSQAPFAATKVDPATASPAAKEARGRLQAVLDKFNPKAGKTYNQWQGFGTRRPATKPAAPKQ